MKILYVTTMYPNPVYSQKGIFCHEQVKALCELGVDVDVVVPIPFYDREVKVKEWCYEKVKIRYIKFFKTPGPRNFHKTGKALFYALKKNINLKQYDLYHADAPLPSGYATMLASEEYNIPFMVHGHGFDVFLDNSYSESKNLDDIVNKCRLVYEKADAIAGVSKKVLDKIQEHVDISGKAHVVYNGVDINKFYPIYKSRQEKYILSVGNLIALKGHDDTIKAFKKLVKSGHKDIKLKIVGRGPLEAELKKLTEKLDISRFVEFVGYVSYEKIADLMRNAVLFCLPSWYEAFGCVYLEAMASGIPVIGCYGNGIDEIITDGVDGFLVEGHNNQQIYEIMKKFFETNLPSNMANNARKTVEQKYKWTDSAEKLKYLYGEIVK